MVIKYKDYVGSVVTIVQNSGSNFTFNIMDKDEVYITFSADMKDIRIVNCIANESILSDIR